uniref:ABC transmembrane type-1 domain-containing protein n=1 Tax=Heterorhabditis bacteriophora TaxID=37862 RepID=A0A1I7X1V9_HETBA
MSNTLSLYMNVLTRFLGYLNKTLAIATRKVFVVIGLIWTNEVHKLNAYLKHLYKYFKVWVVVKFSSCKWESSLLSCGMEDTLLLEARLEISLFIACINVYYCIYIYIYIKNSIFVIIQIALVGQEPVLYARSVTENIGYGLERYDDGMVQKRNIEAEIVGGNIRPL